MNPEPASPERRRPALQFKVLAVGASLAMPGLGHVLIQYPFRGWIWLGLFALSILAGPHIRLPTMMLHVLVRIGAAIDLFARHVQFPAAGAWNRITRNLLVFVGIGAVLFYLWRAHFFGR